jgi:hypothetical protein
MLGCNAAKQAGISAPASTSVMASAWVTTIHNFIGGRTDIVTVVNLYPNGTPVDGVPPIGNISCQNGGITYVPGGGPQSPATPLSVLRASWPWEGAAMVVVLLEPLTWTRISRRRTVLAPAAALSRSPSPSAFRRTQSQTGPRSTSSTLKVTMGLCGRWMAPGRLTMAQHQELGSVIRVTPACSGMSGTFTAAQQ